MNEPDAREKVSAQTHTHTRTSTHRLCLYCVRLQPTTLSSEDAALSREEAGLSVEEPGPPADQLTPVSAPPLPSPLPPARGRERPALELEVPACVVFRQNMVQLSNEAHIMKDFQVVANFYYCLINYL